MTAFSAGSTAGGLGLLMAFAWSALGGGPNGADAVPPATPDLPRAASAAPQGLLGGSRLSIRRNPAGTRQGADPVALQELLRAVEGVPPIACELAAGGVHGFWPGRRSRALLAPDPGAAARLEAGLDAADTSEGARILVDALFNGAGCRARVALGLLDRAEPAHAAPLLRPALGDASPDRRRRAALGLGALESRADRRPLEGLLGDAVADVRIAAAWALGELEDPAAIPALSRALASDADAQVRGAAARALGEISG
ncbi:MAG: HEAT repeat domain-containing protein [Gemmatimonadota bacterium]